MSKYKIALKFKASGITIRPEIPVITAESESAAKLFAVNYIKKRVFNGPLLGLKYEKVEVVTSENN